MEGSSCFWASRFSIAVYLKMCGIGESYVLGNPIIHCVGNADGPEREHRTAHAGYKLFDRNVAGEKELQLSILVNRPGVAGPATSIGRTTH